MRVVCHVGLHKTATTYFQKHVFSAWRQPWFFYNPEPVSGLIRSVFLLAKEREKHPELFASYKRQLLDKLAAFERAHPRATLLLSYEKFSQFDFCQNYAENAVLLHELLPQAEILLFLRYQPNWLYSIYGQAINSGDYQDPFTFFGYRDGVFKSFDRTWGDDGLLKVDAMRADWGEVVGHYQRLFGAEKLKVFFHEDFVANPDAVYMEFSEMLGLVHSNIAEQEPVNTGMSFNLYQGQHEVAQWLHALGFSWLIHSSQKEYHRLLHRMYYKDSKLAYLLRTRPKLVTRSLTWIPRLASYASGGGLFNSQLATMRTKLDAYYRTSNKTLPSLLSGTSVPPIYLTSPNGVEG